MENERAFLVEGIIVSKFPTSRLSFSVPDCELRHYLWDCIKKIKTSWTFTVPWQIEIIISRDHKSSRFQRSNPEIDCASQPASTRMYSHPRWRCIKWADIKSHKIRSVASRSRCVMIILDRSFVHQLESNSLHAILHRSEIKPARNGRRAPWCLIVRLFEILKCDGKNVVVTLSDTVTFYVNSGNDKWYLAPDYERYSHPSTPTRSEGHYCNCSYVGLIVLLYNSCFRMKSVQSNHEYELSLNRLPGANPFGLSGAQRSSQR
jgi:hypothetical protein